MDVASALLQVGVLDAVLVASFVLWVVVMFVAYRVAKVFFCQVCVAVASVWSLNLVFHVLPTWVTVFLMGQSVTGASAMLRDEASERFHWHALPDGERQRRKQLAYFAGIFTLTLGAVVLLALAEPSLALDAL
jgi:hypothetical protein